MWVSVSVVCVVPGPGFSSMSPASIASAASHRGTSATGESKKDLGERTPLARGVGVVFAICRRLS